MRTDRSRVSQQCLVPDLVLGCSGQLAAQVGMQFVVQLPVQDRPAFLAWLICVQLHHTLGCLSCSALIQKLTGDEVR